jgi:hypothetical protein
MKVSLISFLLTINLANAQVNTNTNSMGSANSLVAAWESSGRATNFSSQVNSKNSFFEASAVNLYGIKELTTFSASFAKRINENNTLMFSAARMNNQAFAEQSFETGVAKRLSPKFCAGVKVEYKEWILEDSRYTNSHALIPEVSLLVNALPSVCLGVVVNNPGRSGMKSTDIDRLPSTILTGVAAKISSKVLFGVSAETQSNSSLSVNAGLEYNYASQLILRAGFKSYPVCQSIGFQLKLSKYDLALAMESNAILGISSAVSLIINL